MKFNQDEADAFETGLAMKRKLQRAALAMVQDKMDDLNDQIAALHEASQSETKSSAGDKYETGRESINQSRSLLEKQLSLIGQWRNKLKKIRIGPISQVYEGALIEFGGALIWVAVPLGKLELEGREFQLVSENSPLIQVLASKREGEGAVFRGQQIEILKIW
ncbi:hypothetical protein [Cyclobacterium sp.]|uniref:hypothetical protein n=1 Tax=Cyclobacterium sp. TaxID=1966343 RepID=UPI0019BDE6A0|nr:hypothetical protein [Cyclobacterium sp.]MBD3628063.1 hypothetical protein [Cyclobacterium sp.]